MPSAVEHLVLLKLTRPFNDQEVAAVKTLKKKIPGILRVSAGQNYTHRALKFNYGIVVTFHSKLHEAAYQTHPEHQTVKDQIIKPLLDTSQTEPILALDYEFQYEVCPLGWRSFLLMGLTAGIILGRAASSRR